MANGLTNATSPYLLQHAENPVDWWEWGDEAFAEARATNRPVFLSVGYAACHWCHVMAHESFEDRGVADVLNAGFVPVKVDREERPDVDAVYMDATVAMTGQGGWPMTCLLTPEGDPFWCGTYLPRPQLLQLLQAISTAWGDREAEVRASGAAVVDALTRAQSAPGGSLPLDTDLLGDAVASLTRSFDQEHGGFGTAPKFPPSMVLEFLLRHHARTGSTSAWRMLKETAVAMARGGLYDQLGGGFARYAVDRAWVVPHFEKMLYDNAQLLRVYAHVWQAAGQRASAGHDGDTGEATALRALAERVVRETAQFLLTDLRTTEGGFASSLDADTDGVEGATYVWTPEQLVEVLGPDDGARAADLLAVTPGGTFEHGTSTLQLLSDPDDPQWWAGARSHLRAARAARPQPDLDDKVVTAWNGLAIAALAEAGWLLEEPDWVRAATHAATLVVGTHLVDGRLRRSSRAGRVGSAEAVAEDHGDLIEGLVVLHAVTADPQWLHVAGTLLDDAVARFGDDATPAPGEALVIHDTASNAERLVLRPRARGDNAEPCGQSAIASALLSYGAAAGSGRHLELGRQALAPMGTIAARDPRFAGWALAAAEAATAGPLQVAISDGTGQEELQAVAREAAPAGSLVVAGRAGQVPLLEDRPDVDGLAAAYVCRGTVCDLPVTTAAALREALRP
ncbi:thioredoxin domain-containing protein [Ornithinimicrobium sp. F0845]|uniref:thioredoxin domain-containing protein n=1 Tax=Ornithinimicrobium sp. F0845 TaxID=2926412 RepID=UPI001FF350A9|nr:thioredoxin domain-containing protein [Ornithinimicrobium sp. F0845]MCK0111250.1 thioredoxin domain-containing protein [Ornithinimicrobium sp. F0845]